MLVCQRLLLQRRHTEYRSIAACKEALLTNFFARLMARPASCCKLMTHSIGASVRKLCQDKLWVVCHLLQASPKPRRKDQHQLAVQQKKVVSEELSA